MQVEFSDISKLTENVFQRTFFLFQKFPGDLYDEEAILNWLLTQKNPGGDVIEDLEGQRLKRMIEESPSIAVYFCKFQ